MDLSSLWRSYRDGTASVGGAAALGAAAAAAALAAGFSLVRPLIRIFSRKETEKVQQSRYRRVTLGIVFASLALGAFVLFHALHSPEVRARKMAFQASGLLSFLFTGYVALEVLLGFFGDYLPSLRGRAPVAPIIKDLLRAFVLAGVFILGVKQAFPETDIGALVTTSAILSIVIGLALQESLSNVFAGIMLTIDRPFKPGDWIQVDGKEGKVLDSNWRSTRIQTRDDDLLYVPNSTMAKSTIVNISDPTVEHLCRRRIGIDGGAPPNRVRAVLINAMLHVEGVLKSPPPEAFVSEFDDAGTVYVLCFWIRDYDRHPRIEAEVMRSAWYLLKREGIALSSPVREVHLRRERAERRPEELMGLLRKVDILRPLREEELVMLAQDLSHLLFARGEAICRQGDPGSTFYIIKSGSVAVRAKGADGVEAEVARLEPGSYFGEMSLLTGEPRTSTCTAVDDCELLCLDRESFSVLLQENPPVAQAMCDILAARAQATQARLSEERETAIRTRTPEVESGSRRILERIRGIFGFRR